MILNGLPQFLEIILNALSAQHIDVSNLELDHIGYQASSDEDYDNLIVDCEKLGVMLSEEVIGGRRVGIFQLDPKIEYKQYSISAFELIAPKSDQVCPSALEHVEFVIEDDFETFMAKYPDVEWITKDIEQKDFPMLKLKIDEHVQVKFHLENVVDIVRKISK